MGRRGTRAAYTGRVSAPGWYPDPGGQKGMFRYWDGHAWSPTVSSTPGGTPPGQGFDASRPLGQQTGGTFGPQPQPPSGTGGTGRGGRVWWVLGIAGACVLVLLIALGVRQIAGSATGTGTGPDRGTSQRELCPRSSTPTAVPSRGGGSRDGRVFGGKLSYPTLPAPWSTPAGDSRVPFGKDVHHQSITTETNRGVNSGEWTSWVASVLVAQLDAGDGFYTPQQGSDVVVTCIVGSFYGNSKVTRKDLVSKAMKVQGRDAWLVESQLSFNIRGLQTKGELCIVLIVATAEGEASLFYASIPDNARQWEAPARQAMADLRVEG